MRLDAREAFAVSFPVFVMVVLAVVLVYHWIKEELFTARKHIQRRRRIGIFASNVVLGCAFLPLAVMYRPSLIQMAKAQIRQQEGVDEDESGDPESPLKHLLRQLRRIRRGEEVDTLSLRLE
jgi:predicted PurR-regulated permease PerM